MNDMNQLIAGASKASKKWGIITLIFGLIALALPMVMGLAVTLLFGVVLLIVGFVQSLAAWPGEGRGFSARLVFAIITGIAGLVVLFMPSLGLATLTLFLGIYFVLDGMASLTSALQMRPRHGWGYIAMGGVSSLIMAGIIMWQWPVSSEFVIGILIGVKLIILGLVLISVSRSAERLATRQAQAAEKTINPDIDR
ncbi:hypothetical protein FJQ87_17715 [Shewanella sp. SNU WT4]|uniref:HdeD family acid-resistance protein n=1 Tax=Shewanella sp. SNU WT4 TaxID=2590015 RepID=UPI001129B64C|nr:DUF308 domain-containing protein [Shewanella sp. SNU WT4]QDF68268.1 hypothetical protein FJQ87_17715 [Shewanella sp. SNU WT4]